MGRRIFAPCLPIRMRGRDMGIPVRTAVRERVPSRRIFGRRETLQGIETNKKKTHT